MLDALDRLAAAWPITVGTVTTSGADWTTETGICSVTAANAVAEDLYGAGMADRLVRTISAADRTLPRPTGGY